MDGKGTLCGYIVVEKVEVKGRSSTKRNVGGRGSGGRRKEARWFRLDAGTGNEIRREAGEEGGRDWEKLGK